jgi:hypothetical protein
MKPNGDVRKAAVEIVGDTTDPLEKLHRLFTACRARVKNVMARSSGYTAEMRAKMKANKTPDDTLERGAGTSLDIDLLFASLAQAVGFDARIALLGDRGRFFFNPEIANTYFLHSYSIAVRVGDEWRFFDPGSRFVPWNWIRWEEEASQALVTDPKEPVFIRTPLSLPGRSAQRRKAVVKLADDGTLEGDVSVVYTGHEAVEERVRRDGESKEEREKKLREAVQQRLPAAELSEIALEGLDAPEETVTVRYRVRVPGFAARTGKRLLVSPAYFQRGVPALFTAAERRHEIYFHFPWSEDDEVSIEVPFGFVLEDAAWASPFSAKSLAEYSSSVNLSADGRTLSYRRQFEFRGGFFQTVSYSGLKKLFDRLNESDSRQLSFLRPDGKS